MDLKLRCSASGCDCKNFCAGDTSESLRICESCNHTWITHLLEKLLTAADDSLTVFDVCSLALYGTHALPIRLKIVIERLLTTLNTDDIEKIRRNFGWTLQDLARGYMVQDPRGGVISRWSLLPVEEELIILQQFLRFPVTRPISLALIREDFPVNNNTLVSSNNLLNTPLANLSSNSNSLNNIINNNNSPSTNGKYGSNTNNNSSSNSGGGGFINKIIAAISPSNSPQQQQHQMLNQHNSDKLNSLGIPHKSPLHFPSSGLPSLPGASLTPNSGLKMRSTSPRGQDSVSVLQSSSALNLSVSQNSSDSDSDHHHHQNHHQNQRPRSKHHHQHHHQAQPDMYSSSQQSESAVMDLSVKPTGNNQNHFNHQHNNNNNNNGSHNNSILKARGITVSQALKSVRASMSPKAGQNPSTFEDNINQTLGLMGMGMNMTSLLSNFSNMKSSDLMAAAAAQQLLSSMTAGLQQQQQQQQQQQHQQHQQKKSSSGQASSGSPSPGTGGNHNQNPRQSPLNHHNSMRQQDNSSTRQEQSPNSGGHKKTPSGVKRPWNPLPAPVAMATHLVNPATGKRRVQCAVCLKTFCDKGALKIHFSAVHLREMHKCTVAGCSMMFSSRRSRNRHSANPNPKLHSPHMRRKISPHDGRTAGPAISLNSPTLMLPPSMRYPPYMAGLPNMGSPEEDMEGQMLHDDQIDDDGQSSGDGDEVGIDFHEHGLIKMDKEEVNNEDYLSDDGSISSANEDSRPKSSPEVTSNNKQDGARKRKRNNPVRLPSVPDDSNDEFCCYDDGTVVSNETEDNDNDSGSPKRFKETDPEPSKDSQKSPTRTSSPKSETPKKSIQEFEESGALDLAMSSSPKSDVEKVRDSPKSDKALENGEHVPGSGNNSEDEDDEDKNDLLETEKTRRGHHADVDHLGRLQSLPIFSSPNHNNNHHHPDSDSSEMANRSDDEENTGRSLGSPNSSNGYIPYDRENPRKCSACGKEFQNQFGVKTHYQNVHLKLMHKCTVDGCNAAFPSKRSRDRHSSNLNLHRKLLSTSSDYSPTRSVSPPSSRGNSPGGSIPDVALMAHRPRRPEIDFSGAASAAMSGGGGALSMFNPYMFRSNLLESSLYIN